MSLTLLLPGPEGIKCIPILQGGRHPPQERATQTSLHKQTLLKQALSSISFPHVFCSHFSVVYCFLLKWYVSSQV